LCNLEIPLGQWVFPAIECTKSYNEDLRDLAYAGLKVRKLELTESVKNRLDYELDVIANKGYSPYFLVVYDLLRYAREHDILTNIRGSVAGSLVTYLLQVTKCDPLSYKLPFERFLNPERPSAPDIDMDYADNRRDEMIEYAKKKYGEDKVAQIGTFGTMMARGAVKYDEWNWSKGMNFKRLYESMSRHAMQYYMGDRSEDHLSAVMFNAMAILHFEEIGREEELNDLPKWK
jgi:DNA polymerase-3 subunit alpha